MTKRLPFSLLLAAAITTNSRLASAELVPIGEPTRGDEAMSVTRLKSHYGGRLTEDSFLCSLPPTAMLRQPKEWDCKEWDCKAWTAKQVTWSGMELPFDTVTYRSFPTGVVASTLYFANDKYERLLRNFFTIHAFFFQNRNGKVNSGLPSGEPRGELSASRTAGKFDEQLTLTYENGSCRLALEETTKK